jgi:hypothetical protein
MNSNSPSELTPPARSGQTANPGPDHPAPAPPPVSSPPAPAPQYALRRGLGFWDLTFAGHSAVLRHERGLLYVADLLHHPPPEPVPGLVLALRIHALCGQPGAVASLPDSTGHEIAVSPDATLQQRALSLDDARAAAALHRKQCELERLLEDPDQTEPVKAEAQRDLEAIYAHRHQHLRRARRAAYKAADAVGKAIKRLYVHLAEATDGLGSPHPVLRAFAEHLREHLLMPSGRACGEAGCTTRGGFGGCFTYQPPPGVVWTK